MADQTITKNDVQFEEIRLFRIVDPDTQDVEYFGAVAYQVLTTDPESDYRRRWQTNALGGQPLVKVQGIFLDVYNAVKMREGIP